MPVHNAGNYLASAVDSILAQEQVDLELLIIDDHSTDNAIQELCPNPQIRILNSPKRGIVPALNHGIENARGYWLARMDADDIALPRRLKSQINFLQSKPNIHICGTQVEVFKDDGPADEGYQLYQDWINAQTTAEQIEDAFFVESCLPHPSVCMRTEHIKVLQGYRDCNWPEDYDLWCRARLKGMKFGKPNGIFLRWRDYAKRTSRQDQRYHKDRFLRCKAHYLAKYFNRKHIESCVIWGTGPTGLKLHDYLEAEGIKVASFVDINAKMLNRKKRNKTVAIISNSPDAKELNSFDGMNIIAVSTRGAREAIREILIAAGWQQHREFILAA